MTSGSITSWQIEEEKVETVTAFIFFGSKITADYDCSHEIKRCLLLERKVDRLKCTALIASKSEDINGSCKIFILFGRVKLSN